MKIEDISLNTKKTIPPLSLILDPDKAEYPEEEGLSDKDKALIRKKAN